jgi:hypothetical protein
MGAMAKSLDVQFQLINHPLEPAVTEIVSEVICAHEYAPASETK